MHNLHHCLTEKRDDMTPLVRMKRFLKFRYYKSLCRCFNGLYMETGANKSSIRKLISTVFGAGNSAVWLQIYGEVTGVGYKSWLWRSSRKNGVDCFVSIKDGRLKALLIGPGLKVETVVKSARKGPPRSRITKFTEKWFNTPGNAMPEEERENIAWSAKTVEMLSQNTDILNTLMQVPNSFTDKDNKSNAGEIKRAAHNRNLYVFRQASVNYIASSSWQVGMHGAQSSQVSTIVRSITDNKDLTKLVLKNHGLPVPEGKVFTNIDKAKDYLHSCGHPLAVKPVAGSFGTGVTIGVCSESELEVAWNYARSRHFQVILEEMIEALDVRILVVGGKAKAALLRIPANVVGDGERTIEQLIDNKNMQRFSNPRLSKAPIIVDRYSHLVLNNQGYTMKSIPEKGKIVFINYKANIEAGADSVSVTEYIHPDLLYLAEQAGACFGVNDFWGVDLLIEKLDLPRSMQRCVVIEVNSRANIYNVQYPLYGRPVDVADEIIKHLFPLTKTAISFPANTIKLEVTGIFTSNFTKWAYEHLQLRKLNGNICSSVTGYEVIVSGTQDNLYNFVNDLWGCNNKEVGAVDGIQIYDTKLLTEPSQKKLDTEAFSSFISDLSISSYDDYSLDHDEINQALFHNELSKMDLQPNYLYEELFSIIKDEKEEITGMHHSSIFCDEVCSRFYLAKKLLSFYGLPVSRSVKFGIKQKQGALKYFDHLNGQCAMSLFNPNYVKTTVAISQEDFLAQWNHAKNNGISSVLIEELMPGRHICIAVVAGQAEAALLIEPVSITGDGVSTIGQLIEIKNNQRLKNPLYKKPIKLETDDLNNTNGLRVTDILEMGKNQTIESSVIEYGGDTANISDKLHHDYYKAASKAVNSIPGLDFAYVHMIIPSPDYPANMQRWFINRIDSRPDVAMFHFPWRGKPYNLTKHVIEKLCLTRKVTLGREGM